jgi:glycine C-acetyltransferase
MYSEATKSLYDATLKEIIDAGLYKRERVIDSPQAAKIKVGSKEVLNFCANNYLGLANNQVLQRAAVHGINEFGLGLASVRFICGTQRIHKDLEASVAKFFQADDSILYASCFDANGGLFETILGENDAVVSDKLNHASMIDGIRLCKAKRFLYEHLDLSDLTAKLEQAKREGAQRILVTTDGVFSMDGDVAPLGEICDIAERFDAMVHVDDCHATGFFGPTGRGSVEFCNCMGRVDVITSTFGKALGGAVGGFTVGRKEIIELLRQRSRPYLFSNSLPPALVTASLACIEMLTSQAELRQRLEENTKLFRSKMTELGFKIRGEIHPICPVMLGDAKLATQIADDLLEEGIYVIGFSFPVVPKGLARIRVQMSAGHSREEVERAIAAFAKVGKRHGVIP